MRKQNSNSGVLISELGADALVSCRELNIAQKKLWYSPCKLPQLNLYAQTLLNVQQARAAQNDTLESAIRLYLLNRGVLLTPFHNMMLICPATQEEDIAKLVQVFKTCLFELNL